MTGDVVLIPVQRLVRPQALTFEAVHALAQHLPAARPPLRAWPRPGSARAPSGQLARVRRRPSDAGRPRQDRQASTLHEEASLFSEVALLPLVQAVLSGARPAHRPLRRAAGLSVLPGRRVRLRAASLEVVGRARLAAALRAPSRDAACAFERRSDGHSPHLAVVALAVFGDRVGSSGGGSIAQPARRERAPRTAAWPRSSRRMVSPGPTEQS